MTRQEALLNRLYQQAMKGNVRAIIHLDQKFDEANETIANARMDLPDLLRKSQAAPAMSEEADVRIEEIHRIINALQTLRTLLSIKNDKRRRKKKRRE